MNFETIRFSVNGKIALLKINRPQAKNALNAQVIRELDTAVESVSADTSIRVLVIDSEENFAAGADIKEMMDMGPEEARRFCFHRTYAKIENLPIPTIAAMSGYALGGGLELALVCDIRIASPNAVVGLPEINLGIFPGAGGTQRLPRLIGVSRAKEMIFQGKLVKADQALHYGLINEIADNPIETALKLADKLSNAPPVAIKFVKQCLNAVFTMDLQSGIALEELAWSGLYATKDQKEGMRAFVEKRKPNFTGE
jgi:enoyl-CoA hydratase